MSRAIDLYLIVSDGVTYNLTSAEDPQTYGVDTYSAAAISRGDAQNNGKLSKANMEVQLALDHALSQALLTKWSETVTTLTLFSKRTSGTETLWKGRLVNIVPETNSVRMTFESIFTSMRRAGLRARFQKSCRHALYNRGCTLSPASFAVAATLSSITDRVIVCPEAAGYADGYFDGGMVASTTGVYSYVQEHVGTSLTLSRVSAALVDDLATYGAGVGITLYPGCDHSYPTCRDKFSNDDNYGGFDYIPTKNPMGGSSIV